MIFFAQSYPPHLFDKKTTPRTAVSFSISKSAQKVKLWYIWCLWIHLYIGSAVPFWGNSASSLLVSHLFSGRLLGVTLLHICLLCVSVGLSFWIPPKGIPQISPNEKKQSTVTSQGEALRNYKPNRDKSKISPEVPHRSSNQRKQGTVT